MISIPFEDHPQLMAQFRHLLDYEADAELDAADVIRALEAAHILAAAADVIDASFQDLINLMDDPDDPR